MELVYRIPSKKVPYGFIEVRWEKADAVMPDPVAMAQDYAQYIKDYQAAEVQAFESAPKPTIKPVDEVLSEDEAHDLIVKELGGVAIDEDAPLAAPWDKTSDTEATSTEESKPWNVSDGDWDFS